MIIVTSSWSISVHVISTTLQSGAATAGPVNTPATCTNICCLFLKGSLATGGSTDGWAPLMGVKWQPVDLKFWAGVDKNISCKDPLDS